MNERKKDLMRLSAHQFALLELHLYLDTHPNDAAASAKYDEHFKHYEQLLADFEKKYGPIMMPATGVEWLKNPWPWERTEECDD